MSSTPTLARLSTVSLGTFIAGMILLLCGLSGADRIGGLLALSVFLGWFLLTASLVLYVIHVIFTLMRDHEMWKRSLDREPNDRSDSV